MDAEVLYVFLEGAGALLPEQKGSNYIFYAPANFVLYPHGVALLELRLSIVVPQGFIGRFFSLTDANVPGVYASSQIIHAGHREGLSVMLFNHNVSFYSGRAGDPVACLVLEKVIYPPVRQASMV
ncbi:13.5 kDa protein [Human adenovirus 4a]|uniref:13.5 kDa protein n=1 Tax=Human adenovirus 4a TaxID=35263 RepID=A0A3G9JVA5_ADE04|nr:13.5 kDa protein [Human adenovirus 4a]